MKSFKKILTVFGTSLILTSRQYSYLSCDKSPPTGATYYRVIAILVVFLALTAPVHAQLKLNATGTCSMWLEAGKNKVFRQIEEALVLGLIDGMSLGANMNFWVTREGQLKINQALDWIDSYCRDKPLEHAVTGVWELFNSRAEPVESSEK